MILKERLSDREDNDEPDTTVIELFSSACFPQHIILYYAVMLFQRARESKSPLGMCLLKIKQIMTGYREETSDSLHFSHRFDCCCSVHELLFVLLCIINSLIDFVII